MLISVTDLGKGIPPEDLDRIFEKFYRRGKPDGRSPGTGLGLSIARASSRRWVGGSMRKARRSRSGARASSCGFPK